MAESNVLAGKAISERDELAGMLGPQAPISTDNTNDQPPAQMAPKRIFIYGQGPESTSGGGAPNAVGGDQNAPIPPAQAEPSPGAEGPVQPQPGGNALPEPSPTDNLTTLLQQRDQQADQALKAQGFDGYTADVRNLNDPDSQHSIARAVQDISAGFMSSIAKNLSLPRETIDRGMGLLGLDFMQHGSPQQQTIDTLNRMGIKTYEIENLANKIGRGALPALATFTAMQLAAPSMAAAQGTGAASYLMREIGSWALKHPVVGMWLGQTSQAGGEIAKNAFGNNPLTEFAGELAGGLGPGLVKGTGKLALKMIPGSAAVGRMAGKALGSGIDEIASALPTDLGNAIKKYNPFYKQPIAPTYQEGLVNPNLDINRIQQFAKDQIFAAQTYQDKAIENAINSIPSSGTPAQVQTRTHNLLQDAEKISKRIVSGFWDRVPLKKKISVLDLRRDVLAMQKELVDSDNVRPDEMIQKVINATNMVRLPNGTIKAPTPTIQRLRDLASQIGRAITLERASDAPREGFVRNLARLAEMIDDNIALQLPNDTSIEQARQMSKRHNDLFSRGPINDILSKRRTGDFRVPQADSIDTLLQKTDGLAALKAVSDGVSSYPRIPTNRFRPAAYYSSPTAVTPQEKQTLDQMISSAEDAIRGAFREAAEQGPQKAVAYTQKNEDGIKALSKAAGELNFAAAKLSATLSEQKQMQASAFSRFAQTTPDKAVQNIFAQKDPADTARQLMVVFKRDPDALEGFRNAIAGHFIYNVGKLNPNLMLKMLHEPRIGNLLEATLSPEQFQRLSKMTNVAVRMGIEDMGSLKEVIHSVSRTAGKIFGAMLGRRLETGTMQGPQIASQRMAKIMDGIFKTTDPADMLAQAVLDPTWEALLYSRVPTTTRDMKAAMVKYRRLFAGINTAQQQTLNKLSKDKAPNDDE